MCICRKRSCMEDNSLMRELRNEIKCIEKNYQQYREDYNSRDIQKLLIRAVKSQHKILSKSAKIAKISLAPNN